MAFFKKNYVSENTLSVFKNIEMVWKPHRQYLCQRREGQIFSFCWFNAKSSFSGSQTLHTCSEHDRKACKIPFRKNISSKNFMVQSN